MSFLVFLELVAKIWEKINEYLAGRERGIEESERSDIRFRRFSFDCRIATVSVDASTLSIRDPQLFIDIPLIEPPVNLRPQATQQVERNVSSQVPMLVMSSRELITSEVANVLRKYFNIDVSPDVEEKRESEKG